MGPIASPRAIEEHVNRIAQEEAQRQAREAAIRAQYERETRGAGPLMTWGPAVAGLADAVSTKYALSQGGEEMNPLLAPFVDNDLAFYATKLGTGLLAGHIANKLAKSGHKNMAKVVGSLGIAVPLGAAVWNTSQASRR